MLIRLTMLGEDVQENGRCGRKMGEEGGLAVMVWRVREMKFEIFSVTAGTLAWGGGVRRQGGGALQPFKMLLNCNHSYTKQGFPYGQD